MSPFEAAVKTVQFLAVDAVEKAKSGHPGAPMGLAGIAVEIFAKHLRYVPDAPDWPNRDRFILSCGHASMLLYSMLYLTGYDVTLDDLKQFRQLGARTPGHPEFGMTPGVETTTGPLGQGVGNAVGMALSAKMAKARLDEAGAGPDLIDYRIFCIASDGDLMEGVAMEASTLAGHYQLDNLVVVYDDNEITIDGAASLALSEDTAARYEAMGWYVQRVDGHDPEAVGTALTNATDAAGPRGRRPSLIVARTVIGRGAPTKAGTAASHGAPLGAEEAAGAKKAAGWPETPFHIAPGAREVFAEQIAANRTAMKAWEAEVAGTSGGRAEAYRTLLERAVPADLLARILSRLEQKDDATRGHSGRVLQLAAAEVPSLVSGSADLTESTKSAIRDASVVSRERFTGSNFHFGVREHAMGSIMNGMALSGLFTPAGSTFLIFSDYMRPPIRLASLMKQQAIYIFTHDSIFVGEDGPTHQPIEQLWMLRMVPGVHVFRPADSVETAAAWTHALVRRDGPTALSLTRHKVPELSRPEGFQPEDVLKGGYVVRQVAAPDLVLMATGSEVSTAVAAAELMAKKGQQVRVVSMPCVELFVAQPAAYQAEVLGTGLRRASLEAGRAMPWKMLTGVDGINVGIDTFGASAPWDQLADHFGLTPEQVAATLAAAL